MKYLLYPRNDLGRKADMRFAVSMVMTVATLAGMTLPACIMQPAAPKEKGFPDLYVPSGTTSPALSLGFEVGYDPQLDNLVPGYKIITVAITNSSLEYLQTDPYADQWWVIDRGKSRQKAIITLREKDPDTWATLPPKLRKILEYPLMVRIAETATIDLLIPNTVNLNEFREVVFKTSNRQKTIHIIPRE